MTAVVPVYHPRREARRALKQGYPRDAGSVRCWNDSRTLACDVTREICVDDYAHVAGGDHCVAIPSACAASLTCDCLTANIHCGITTSCTMTGGPNGLPMLVCQPD